VEEVLVQEGLLTTLEARRKAVMLLKLVDLTFFGASPRLLTLDSDVLFFCRPDKIIDAVRSAEPVNLFGRDLPTTYNLLSDEGALLRHGLRLFKGHNAGLGLLQRDSLSLEGIDRYLQDPELRVDDDSEPIHLALIEQSLHGLIGATFRCGLLPDTYLLSLEPGASLQDGVVARHYAGASRRLMYTEGMPQLIRNGFLQALGIKG
jgi:hypothetical protein